MMQWFAATVAVLALVLIAARGLRWILERSHRTDGPVQQVGAWRVAPDASVRAIRVHGRVHILYERGRNSVFLETVDASELPGRKASSPSIVPTALRAKVARG